MTKFTLLLTISLININAAIAQFQHIANTCGFKYKNKNIEHLPDTVYKCSNAKYFFFRWE